jgi:hypothetical protein
MRIVDSSKSDERITEKRKSVEPAEGICLATINQERKNIARGEGCRPYQYVPPAMASDNSKLT